MPTPPSPVPTDVPNLSTTPALRRAVDYAAIVQFLAVGGRADRLAAEHVPDAFGLCRSSTAGPQRGHIPWPCTLATLAARGEHWP